MRPLRPPRRDPDETRAREDKGLDPTGTLRALPEPFRSMWLDDAGSRSLLQRLRRLQLIQVLSRLGMSASVALFVTAPLAIAFGGPASPTAIAARFAIAAITTVPAYGVAIWAQGHVRGKIADVAVRLGHYQANRHAELARRTRHRWSDERDTPVVARRELEGLPRQMQDVAGAIRGLCDSGSAGRAAGLFAAAATPLWSAASALLLPPLYFFLGRQRRQMQDATLHAHELSLIASERTAAAEESASERTSAAGTASAHAAGLHVAAEEIHSEILQEALSAQRDAATARVDVEVKTHNQSGGLSALLMWAGTALGISPGRVMVLLGALQVKATYAGPDATYRKTLDDYARTTESITEHLLEAHPARTTRRQESGNEATPIPVLQLMGLTARHGPDDSGPAVWLTVPAGSVTIIAGDNGTGKSSLLSAVRYTTARANGTAAGLDGTFDQAQLDAEVLMLGTDARPHFQEMLRAWRVTPDEVITAMTEFGVPETISCDLVSGKRSFDSLSDGQKARALVGPYLRHAPQRVLLFDEPISKLDLAAKRGFVRKARQVAEERQRIILMTSNESQGLVDADRLVILGKNRTVRASGTPASVLRAERLPTWLQPLLNAVDPAVDVLRREIPLRDLATLAEPGQRPTDGAYLMIPSPADAALVLNRMWGRLPETLFASDIAAAARLPPSSESHNIHAFLGPICGFELAPDVKEALDRMPIKGEMKFYPVSPYGNELHSGVDYPFPAAASSNAPLTATWESVTR